MKRWHLLIFLAVAIVMLAAPVSADYLNVSEFGVSSAGKFQTVSLSPGETSVYTASTGYVVVLETSQVQDDDATLTTVYTFKNGATVTRTIKTTSSYWSFSGKYTVTYSGGNAYDINYFAIPLSSSNAPVLKTGYVIQNSTKAYYLFTDVQSRRPDPITTTVDAYTSVYDPATNPITSVSQSCSRYALITYKSVMASELPADVKNSNSQAAGKVQEDLLGMILASLQAIVRLGETASTYVSWLMDIGLITFSVATFATLNAMYLIWLLVDSFWNSADLFQSVRKVIRGIDKLFGFYAKLFKAVKEVIKWW